MNSPIPPTETPGLRVAFLNPDLWVGGSTIFALNLGGELLRRGIPAEVFSLDVTHSLEADFRNAGVPVTRMPRRGMIFEDRTALILEALRRFEPTVVLACVGFGPCEVLPYLPTGVARVGLVHAVHPGIFTEAANYLPWFDRIAGVSGAVADEVKSRLRFAPERVMSIDLGVPISPPRTPSPPGNPLRILYLGRLEEPSKRVRMFPRILARLRESGIPFHWTVAGIGPELEFLQAQMKSGADQRVEFAGLIPYAQVPALLARHDVILLTSSTETFSLSLHEAMGAGLVPVASDIPGRVSEVVTSETGRRVPMDSPEGYADAIVWLHAHRAEMNSMSQAARRKIAEEHSMDRMADRWEAWMKVLVPTQRPVWPSQFKIRAPVGRDRLLRYQPFFRAIWLLAGRTRSTLSGLRRRPDQEV